MLLKVIDGEGILQTIVAPGQVALVTDWSGVIDDTGEAQVLMPANAERSGWFIQKVGGSIDPLYVNDLGQDATPVPVSANGSVELGAGDMFPPVGYPLTVGAISIFGTPGDTFVAREW